MIEQQFAAYQDFFTALEWLGLALFGLILIDTFWDYLTKQRKSLAETLANYAISLGNFLLERTAFGLVFIAGLIIAQGFAIASIESSWWSWTLAILVADFTYYWMHRVEHEVRFLWAYHSVHHNSPEFNLSTSLRLAWIEGMFEWVFFVPMVLLGFSTAQALGAIAIVVIYQTWLHTEKIGKLGWLDRVFNTPSVHRVHHGSNKKYHDKNYGGILIIWDRLFGTYQTEEEPVVYGISTPIESANPVVINFKEYGLILRDIKRAQSWRQAWKYLFGRPGWQP